MAVNIISRQNAEALIQEQVAKEIIQEAPKSSVVMQLGRRLPDMTSDKTRLRVLDALPMAYFVNGDTGRKQTTSQEWEDVYLNTAELATIVPIPEAVLDDADVDIIGEVVPRVREAMGSLVDSAIVFGNNRPTEWTNSLYSLIQTAGNNVTVGQTPDYFDLIMAENGLLAKVEADGYNPNGAIAGLQFKSVLRGLRTTGGTPLFVTSMQGATPYAIDGNPLYFPENGMWDASKAQIIAGDFSKLVYAIRKDVTVKVLSEGVIQDTDGTIAYNLAQQDMIALRVVMRLGWALPNPATRLDPSRSGCPFALIEPAQS